MRFLAYYKFETLSGRRNACCLDCTERAFAPYSWDLLNAENNPNIPIYVQIKNLDVQNSVFGVYGKGGLISPIGVSKENSNYGIAFYLSYLQGVMLCFFDFKGLSRLDGKSIRGSVIEAFVVSVNPCFENSFRKFCNGDESVSRGIERIKRYILTPIVPKDIETVLK